MNIGLVLSGGGAKGAYQAGVIGALAKHKINVSMIAGASIGSLNGAIVAASSDMDVAAERLAQVWQSVVDDPVLKMNTPAIPRYLMMLAAAGLTGPARAACTLLMALAESISNDGQSREDSLLSSAPLKSLLDKFLDADALRAGIPLFVSLYPHTGNISSLLNAVKGDVLGRFETRESVFRHVQSLADHEQREALLASAAIPVLFAPRKVEGQVYSDGGQGNYAKVQGNTPITPLLGKGLDAIIVSHLSDGSFWDAGEFPNETVLEIRPSIPIAEDGAADMLGFKADKITAWMKNGEADTDLILEKLRRIARARTEMSGTTSELKARMEKSGESLRDVGLEDVMRRLRDSQ